MRRIAVVFLALAICSSSANAQQFVVSTDWLQANLHKVKVLDTDDRASYDGGHIPGAISVPTPSLLTTVNAIPAELPPVDKLESVFRDAGIGDRAPIVIYSRDPLHAARAWFTLDYLGHGARASILDGGYAKWTAERRATSKDAVTATPEPFHATVRASSITRLQAVEGLVRNRERLGSDLVLIDARAASNFSGEQAGDGVKCAGHIPGAVNVPWMENFTGGAVPVLRSAAELRDLYQSVGVTETSANVLYCRTGMQASVTYFVLRSLGYEPTLYDGSFIEWSNAGQSVQ